MTQDEIIEMAQECKLIGMRPHLDGIYSEALVAFAKLVAAKERLEYPMREVQRLGQEIEQEPCVHAKNPKGCYRVRCQVGDKCVDDEMSFRTTPPQRTEPICPECKAEVLYECVACSSNNYPPQRTWVGLMDEEVIAASASATYMDDLDAWTFAKAIEQALKEKNT